MAAVINTNISSLNAQRNLTTSQSSLATSLQRLSSGLRINSAKDDAAGLAISERFSTQIRGMNVAVRNANDGVSLAQSAEGAMTEIGNNLQRIRELAVQSRNATNSDSDRAALNAEANQLKAEIQRVAETTSFNGTKLLDGSFTAKSFQVGADQGQTIDIAQIANANTTQLGTWTSVATSASITGATPAPTTAAAAATPTTSVASGAYVQAASATATDAFQFKIDGTVVSDRLVGDASAANLQTDIAAFVSASNGAYSLSGTVAAGTLTITKADGSDLAIATSFSNGVGSTTAAAGATSDGTFAGAGFVGSHTGGTEATVENYAAIADGALTINSVGIGAVAEASTSAQRATALVNAINAKTTDTGVTASLNSGKLVLKSATGNITVGGTVTGTGLTAGVSGAAAGGTAYAAGGAKQGFEDLDISTAEGADNAILAMDAALTAINSARADMGAVQNRFTSVVASLQTTSENMAASRSRILDADFAAETANLTRGQILQQAGTAMLAQANSLPNGVLSLLRG